MHKLHKAAALTLGIALIPSASYASVSAATDTNIILVGYRGDVNFDDQLTVADAVILQHHIINHTPLTGTEVGERADLNDDGVVDVYDIAFLKQCLLGTRGWIGIYDEVEVPSEESVFIDAPLKAINSSLPTYDQGDLVIFYIDFPDCSFSNQLTAEQIDQIAFGPADETSPNYPFESMTAFHQRASKGSFQLSGKTFSYTAQNSISVYNDDKVRIVEECYEAFKDSVDFSQFDANGDGRIDATYICVPESASTDYWWPCSGAFGDSAYRVDGVAVGNIITGNAVPSDPMNFNSTVLHEMGHCMGLPDYYLYYSDNSEGMSGAAGTELMDTDAYSDFSAFSKLMAGWYRENQVSVYDASAGAQTFTLHNAQTDDGNCVLIPYGTLDESYFSEYFLIEYITEDGNNAAVGDLWWQDIESGIRIQHVNAELHEGYWGSHLKYQNGSEFTNFDDEGIRLLRLVNDGGGTFKTGAVINASTPGFGWYDANEAESIDPGVTISIGECTEDGYTITITPNN